MSRFSDQISVDGTVSAGLGDYRNPGLLTSVTMAVPDSGNYPSRSPPGFHFALQLPLSLR